MTVPTPQPSRAQLLELDPAMAQGSAHSRAPPAAPSRLATVY